MDEYTIFCTAEQTRKALNLGAPLEIGEGKGTILCRLQNYHTYKRCVIPTAEQMLGWLDEQGLKISLLYDYEYHGKWDYDSDYKGKQMPCTSMGEFDTRKSATLDAIDEALKFLETHKQ